MNPHDHKIRDHGIIIKAEDLPYIGANDIAGLVELVGSNVSSFKPGDRVFAQANTRSLDGGGLQQFAIISADLVGRTPLSANHDDVATLPTVAMAAFIALFHESGLGLPLFHGMKEFDYPSQSLLVIGGGSSCGKLVIEFARLVGFGKIIAIASKMPEKEAELRKLGATLVIDRHAENLAEEARKVIGDDLIYAVDTINIGDCQKLGVTLLSTHRKGTLITLLPGNVDEAAVADKNARHDVRFSMGIGHLHRELGVQFWQHITGWLDSGSIRYLPYRVIDGLKADEVNAALDKIAQGETVKNVVHPNED